MEKTVVIFKPDSLNRSLVGDILSRFEHKGLQVIAMKMIKLDDPLLDEHYAHHKNKPFASRLWKFMKSSPVIAAVLEGRNAVETVRNMAGPTDGTKAPHGTIRGDFGVSTQCNLIHVSDSHDSAKAELKRFFKPDEIFEWKRVDEKFLYADDEK
ncbi:MAG: nucleoside-diphosphate kinase [Candidatus Aenigmarchaeota archaeon]|nr:nucleoside-diphosphate kinase [Candidatus Aenigmarchaeota archaeon]